MKLNDSQIIIENWCRVVYQDQDKLYLHTVWLLYAISVPNNRKDTIDDGYLLHTRQEGLLTQLKPIGLIPRNLDRGGSGNRNYTQSPDNRIRILFNVDTTGGYTDSLSGDCTWKRKLIIQGKRFPGSRH